MDDLDERDNIKILKFGQAVLDIARQMCEISKRQKRLAEEVESLRAALGNAIPELDERIRRIECRNQ